MNDSCAGEREGASNHAYFRRGRRFSAFGVLAFGVACGGARVDLIEGGSGTSGVAGTAGTAGAAGTSGTGQGHAGTGGGDVSDPAGPATGMQVLYEGEDNPSAIALDDRYIYWASLDVLRRAPLAGGEPVTLATGQYLRGMLPFGDHVYFSESASASGRIARVLREGGEPEWIADVQSASSSLVVAGDSLFWADSGISDQTGVLWRAGLDGSNPTALLDGLSQPDGLVHDGGFIYFANLAEGCSFGSGGSACYGGGIHRVPVDGGEPEQISELSAASNLIMHGSSLYWLASYPPRVMTVVPGEAEREVANVLYDSGNGASFTADADALYWASEDKVLRMPFESGEVTRLVTQLDGASAVVARGDWAYVAEGTGGRILRVATDGSANRPAGPITGPCPTPLGTPEEIALTPRADTNLELLALSLEPDNLTARQATYDRVVADIAAIRTLAPELATIGYFGSQDGKSINMGLSDVAAQSIEAGEYSAWDCLNDFYGVEELEVYGLDSRPRVSLKLDGIYAIPRIAELYAELPGIEDAGSDGAIGDGPTLCAARDGARYEYVVDVAGGDCPSGCTEHEAHRFSSAAAGQVTAGEVWESQSGNPMPEWFREICN